MTWTNLPFLPGTPLKWLPKCLAKVRTLCLLLTPLNLWHRETCLELPGTQAGGNTNLRLSLTQALWMHLSFALWRFLAPLVQRLVNLLSPNLLIVLLKTPRHALQFRLVTKLSRLVFNTPLVFWTLRLRTVTRTLSFSLEKPLTVRNSCCVLRASEARGGERRQ